MRMFLLNLILALIWAVASGIFTLASLAVGFAVGYLVLLVLRPAMTPSNYHRQFWRALLFVLFYVKEVTLASLRVVHDVLTPTHHMNPGVIGLPLDARTDLEITALANLISFTPGTLSLDVSEDRRTLYIHAMYIDFDDVNGLRDDLKVRLEKRVLDLLRGPDGVAPRGEGEGSPPREGA